VSRGLAYAMPAPLGQIRPAILTCPPCSYFVDSSCVVCADDDPHPGCAGCVGGRVPPPPWYKHDLVVNIVGSAIVTIVGSIVFTQLKRRKII